MDLCGRLCGEQAGLQLWLVRFLFLLSGGEELPACFGLFAVDLRRSFS